MNFKKVNLDTLKGLDVGQIAAIYAARRSSIYSFQTGAAIVRDGKLLEHGWSHVGATKWKQTPYSTHAEAHAIMRLGVKQAKGSNIYIATLSRKGNLTMGCPCESCQEFIEGVGFDKITFTNPESLFGDGWSTVNAHNYSYLKAEREHWSKING